MIPSALVELTGAVAGIAAIVGVLLNNHRRRACFVVWMGSNALSAALHVDAALWTMAGRDVVFLALAVHGWRCWSRPDGASP